MKGKLRIGVKGRLERRIFYSPDGCWLWLGVISSSGYGFIKIDGGYKRTHRVSYETHIGPIPKGMFVCHTCDVPLCINPNHLFLGTLQDNNYDMYKKGRNYKSSGDQNPRSKLREKDIPRIIELRNKGMYYHQIGKLYGVTDKAISAIFQKRTWGHLNLLP